MDLFKMFRPHAEERQAMAARVQQSTDDMEAAAKLNRRAGADLRVVISELLDKNDSLRGKPHAPAQT